MAKDPTMMGRLLSRVHNARFNSRLQAIEELWKRNNLLTEHQRAGYKIAETKMMHRDGTEVTEYRLYKLIDASVVTVEAEVKTTVATGVSVLKEFDK